MKLRRMEKRKGILDGYLRHYQNISWGDEPEKLGEAILALQHIINASRALRTDMVKYVYAKTEISPQ